MKVNKKIISVALSSFLVSGFAYNFLYNPDNEIVADAKFAVNIKDKNEVVDFAEDVVMATVISKEEVKEDGFGVYTPYKIKIESPIKGSLEEGKEILISQRLGYDKKMKKHVKLTKDDKYLEVGSKYVFSVTYDDRENIYRIVAPETGNTKVKSVNENKVNKTEIEEFKKAAVKVDAFKKHPLN